MRNVVGALRACLLMFVVGSITFALCGCSTSMPGVDGASRVLTRWSVSSLDPADFTITATFADGQVTGAFAVNRYHGTYTAGADGAFSVSALSATKMAGPEPAMRAQSTYVELLAKVHWYRVDGDQLTLLDAQHNELLTFTSGEA